MGARRWTTRGGSPALGAGHALGTRSAAQQLGTFLSAGLEQSRITLGSAFDFARLHSVRAVADAVAGDGGQDAAGQFRQFGCGGVQQRRPKLVERLHGAGKSATIQYEQ